MTSTDDKGRTYTERMNKYFIMYGESATAESLDQLRWVRNLHILLQYWLYNPFCCWIHNIARMFAERNANGGSGLIVSWFDVSLPTFTALPGKRWRLWHSLRLWKTWTGLRECLPNTLAQLECTLLEGQWRKSEWDALVVTSVMWLWSFNGCELLWLHNLLSCIWLWLQV